MQTNSLFLKLILHIPSIMAAALGILGSSLVLKSEEISFIVIGIAFEAAALLVLLTPLLDDLENNGKNPL